MLNVQPLLLNDCVLKSDQIDIWLYPLHADNPEAKLRLSPEEQHRAARFYFPRHQRRFTNAHSMLRSILARYLTEQPLNLNFTAGKYGKPELLNAPFLQFNLSHSGDMAILAVGKDYPLGIDLERFSARPYYGIGEQLFSKQEIQALRKAPAFLTALTFFNIWTQKEAFIKACGLGLSYPTQQFDVPILSSTPQIVPDTLHQRSWQIMSFMPQISCCASLCYDTRVQKIRYLAISENDLHQLENGI